MIWATIYEKFFCPCKCSKEKKNALEIVLGKERDRYFHRSVNFIETSYYCLLTFELSKRVFLHRLFGKVLFFRLNYYHPPYLGGSCENWSGKISSEHFLHLRNHEENVKKIWRRKNARNNVAIIVETFTNSTRNAFDLSLMQIVEMQKVECE